MRVRVADVLATAALAASLTGVTYAAVAAPRNSVNSRAIKTSAVRAADLRSGAVDGRRVADGSLTAVDVASGVRGPAGPTGADGAAGPMGARGENATALLRGRTDAPVPLTASNQVILEQTWTQATGEIDLIGGGVVVVPSADVFCNIGLVESLNFTLTLDGKVIASNTTFSSKPEGLIMANVFPPGPYLIEPAGAATPHTLTLRASENCSTGTFSVRPRVDVIRKH